MKKIIIFIVLFFTVCFGYHRIRLLLEESKLIPPGKIVEVNNHNMHVYVDGNNDSKYTLVFLSGYGTPSPYYDFRALFSLFRDDYKIAVIEKAGYGFSDDVTTSRDIDTILYEDRMSLEKAGVNLNNLILFPHSMSGVEASYWANMYEEEVSAIIGLDAAYPIFYLTNENNNSSGFEIDSEFLTKAAIEVGLARLFPYVMDKMVPAFERSDMTNDDKYIYRALIYRKYASNAIRNEGRNILESAKIANHIDKRDIPMLSFISSEEALGDNWKNYQIDYLNNKTISKYEILDCAHYVQDFEYEKIYEEANKFIINLDSNN